jgi:uncharacterized membrane protein YcaP (DUF421 family)
LHLAWSVQPKIHAFDLKRLLIGEAPVSFLGEIAVRAVVTYVILLIASRLLGKRVAGQMSVLELTVIVTLGAAIGVPLEVPERGLIPAIIVLAIAVIYQRAIGFATFKRQRAVAVLEGRPESVIRDGVLDLEALRHVSLSRERLFALLRQQQVLQLGQVKRAYLEASGQLSVYLDDRPRAGLAILPGDDQRAYEDRFGVDGEVACRSCGHRAHVNDDPCEHCGALEWQPAVALASIRDLR